MLSDLSLSLPAHAACPSDFTGTTVFGIDICADKGIATGDLAHAAAVMTGILDFDKDGPPDNADVVGGLAAQPASPNWQRFWRAWNLPYCPEEAWPEHFGWTATGAVYACVCGIGRLVPVKKLSDGL